MMKNNISYVRQHNLENHLMCSIGEEIILKGGKINLSSTQFTNKKKSSEQNYLLQQLKAEESER